MQIHFTHINTNTHTHSVFSRGLGVVLLIALGGAWDQILPHIGSKGCDSIVSACFNVSFVFVLCACVCGVLCV